MNEGQSISIIHRFFHFTSIRNTGAAMGILKDRTMLLSIISILSIGLFTYLLILNGDLTNETIYTLSLLFVIAGAIGNLIDRITRKGVVDFLDIQLFGYHLPIFNVADFLLLLGTLLFII